MELEELQTENKRLLENIRFKEKADKIIIWDLQKREQAIDKKIAQTKREVLEELVFTYSKGPFKGAFGRVMEKIFEKLKTLKEKT